MMTGSSELDLRTSGHVANLSVATDRRTGWALAIITLLVFSVAAIATYIPDQPQLGLFDEWVYLDYVDQTAHLGVAQRGETVIGETLEVLSCRGVQFYGTIGSPCGGPYDSTIYPQGGITAADVHPPTYFWATALGASMIQNLGPSDDLLTTARLMGALWLFLGLLTILMLSVELGAPLTAGVGIGGVIAALPLTRYTNSYLTPDNLNLAVGALVMLAAVRFTRGRWPWWTLALAGGLAGSVKTQNGLAVGVAVLFILWCATVRGGTSTRGLRALLAGAGAAIAGFVTIQVGWQVARGVLAVGDVPEQGVLGPITRNLLVGEFAAFILGLSQKVTDDIDPVTAYFSTALLVAGCVGALLYRSRRDDVFGLAAATTTMLIIGSPLFVISWQLLFGEVIPSPTRYGGSLLPGMAAVTAAAFTSRVRSFALCCFGTFVVGALVVDNVMR